jgi:hypothetical protein
MGLITMPSEEFPASLEDRLAELEAARSHLLSLLEDSRTHAASTETPPERWSVAEVVYHLYLTEKSILKMLRKALASGNSQERRNEGQLRAEWEHVRSLLGNRQLRVRAPSIAEPANPPDLGEAVRLLKQSRREVLEMLRNANLDDLGGVSMPHPFPVVGTLTGAGWLSLIAYHESRHAEQIVEIMQGKT